MRVSETNRKKWDPAPLRAYDRALEARRVKKAPEPDLSKGLRPYDVAIARRREMAGAR